ncbi:MAG: hypothetical protein Q7T82_14535 [Armatimonadota bacterium]|nr:hypothetical protein [Armatimonadota bacterium]
MSRRLVLICAVSVAVCAGAPARAYLKVHPANPHYFLETTTGKPVLFASCAGYVPTDRDCDYRAQIKKMREQNLTYGRVWHFLPWAGENAIWPWARSGRPGAPMGGNKIDMNLWNPEYWDRMSRSVSEASKAGIYSEIHLFERCGMSPASPTRWRNNPWASDNNVNDIETPDASKDGTPDFYLYEEKPNLRAQQERYVRKMIDRTVKSPYVIYEIENEHWEYDNPKFAEHYARFVKEYIARKYPTCPRLVSHSSLQNDLEAFYKIPYVDIVNRHFGNEAERNPDALNRYIEPRWSRNKAINIDEFANGVTETDLLRKMCWIIITSGGNFHIEDAVESSRPAEVCESIRQFRVTSGWDFVHSAPNRSFIASGDGYCMARPGKEYAAYFPAGGTGAGGLRVRRSPVVKEIDLAPGLYRARWWNPRASGFSKPTLIRGGGVRRLRAPDAQDWALHVRAAGDRWNK